MEYDVIHIDCIYTLLLKKYIFCRILIMFNILRDLYYVAHVQEHCIHYNNGNVGMMLKEM